MRLLRVVLLSGAFVLLPGPDSSPLHAQTRIDPRGFTSAVSERLIDAYTRRFGAPARGRLEAWKQYAAQRRGSPGAEAELLLDVNRTLNRIRFIDDQTHWGEADYWATPAESIASNGGDCEDFTIAKYFLLKELGVPVSRMRMTYVKSLKLNQPHMVLAYYPRPDAEPLVLDNLEETVRPASQRTDLIPVYSFNDEEVWIEARGKSGSPRQIRNWNMLLERLERELNT
jgi:predicted transglutaminase-like cysteine proteinase